MKSDWVTTAPRTDKPWGHEELFALVDGRYAGKTIHVTEGHALSLQFHERKEETISVQSGPVEPAPGAGRRPMASVRARARPGASLGRISAPEPPSAKASRKAPKSLATVHRPAPRTMAKTPLASICR